MGSYLGGLVILGACAAFAQACEQDGLVTETARLVVVPGCGAPLSYTQVSVGALGNFPPAERFQESLNLPSPAVVVDRFPVDARALVAEARTSDSRVVLGARLITGAGRDGPLLLLPPLVSCGLTERALVAPAGASVVPLPDGGALIVGGLSGAAATRRVVWLGPSSMSATELAQGLSVRRYDATATPVANVVLVVGGSSTPTGMADDSFELLTVGPSGPSSAGPFSLCPAGGAGCFGRRSHGAVVVAERQVLVVGGVSSSSGGPLASAVVVDVDSRVVTKVGDLPEARSRPIALRLEDGTVVVVGGIKAGLAGPEPAGDVFVYDLQRQLFEPAHEVASPTQPLILPAADAGQAIALVGSRVAWLGSGSDGRDVVVLQRTGDLDSRQFRRIVMPQVLPAALVDLRVTALSDGSILATGLEQSPAPQEPGETVRVPRAYWIDLGVDAEYVPARSLGPSACLSCSGGLQNPVHVTELADGTILELGSTGAALRRIEVRTRYGTPAMALPALNGAFPYMAFDAAPNWVFDDASFRAEVDGARVDLATLRFTDLALEADVVAGEAELLLVRDGQPPHVITLGEQTVRFGDCSTERQSNGIVEIRREGSRLWLSGGVGAPAPCVLPDAVTAVGIAVRLQRNAALRRLQISRL